MELLLNEKSLDGQFTDLAAFYESLPVMSRNLRILRESGVSLCKHSSLYKRKITGDTTILDLQNRGGRIAPGYRDQVRRWKRELSALVKIPPFWDTQDLVTDQTESVRNTEVLDGCGTKDSLEEAARRGTDVLSFLHPDYQDVLLYIDCDGKSIPVRSAVSTKYLLDLLMEKGVVDPFFYLKMRHGGGRIRMDYLDEVTASVSHLQKTEVQEVASALDRFDDARSWEEIFHDRFFNHKRYQPSSKKEDCFYGTRFAKKQIDKFRCGQHSRLRCFGYREEDCFYVLMVERDHSVSDHG